MRISLEQSMRVMKVPVRELAEINRNALTRAAHITTDAYKSVIRNKNAPHRKQRLRKDGTYRKSYRDAIRFKVWQRPNSEEFVLIIGAETGSGRHAHLVDKGTRPRFTKTKKYRGVMPAAHYADIAMKSTGTQLMAEYQRIFLEGIDRFLSQNQERM